MGQRPDRHIFKENIQSVCALKNTAKYSAPLIRRNANHSHKKGICKKKD